MDKVYFKLKWPAISLVKLKKIEKQLKENLHFGKFRHI